MSQSQSGETKRQLLKRKERELVSKYDIVEKRARDSTQEAVKPDDAGRKKFTQLFEDLYEVQDTQNTDQDAKGGAAAAVRSGTALARLAHIGLKRSKNIVQGGGSFNVKDFVKHLKNKFPGSVAEEDADVSLDWKKNSKVAVEFFAATPTALCLAHPLSKSFEPKPRKAIVRQRKDVGEEVRPLINVEGNTDNANSEKRKQQLLKAMKRLSHNKIRLGQLIVDPHSFGETCENMFAYSFLVERNDAAVTVDDEGILMAHEVVHDEGNANQVHESEDVVRDVLRMDWKTYHNLVDELYPGGVATNRYFKFDPSLPEEAV